MGSFEQIWKRIVELEGNEFRQVRGKIFTYKISGDSFIPSTTNYIVPRSQLEKAWQRMPLEGPGAISDLVAPSYIFALLMDTRVLSEVGDRGTQTSSYSNNHQHITGDFAEHLVMYWLSKKGYECAHVQHVGIDIIAAKDGKRLGISVKSRSRKTGIVNDRMTINYPEKHVQHVRETCRHFNCEEFFAFVLDQNNKIKVILTPLSCIEHYYVISSKSSQDWNMSKFEFDPSSQIFELAWN
ncbi:hypothetical protein D3P07_21870 [Paenibacillus sp. 1011MAR3C5]|uniref:hypothetical protein n=1 Tax=Paenibacillus sp. 1011MAR3C5 TaxID=1675787 RepID=UPI000E6CB7E5|nr:hypothetical protein [Paenibacillus sp. 1011MAR3C5]RJE85215.1 hypothetical protein D3P07_21870 [Paenibacillus sp. 1011MAR3C5]